MKSRNQKEKNKQIEYIIKINSQHEIIKRSRKATAKTTKNRCINNENDQLQYKTSNIFTTGHKQNSTTASLTIELLLKSSELIFEFCLGEFRIGFYMLIRRRFFYDGLFSLSFFWIAKEACQEELYSFNLFLNRHGRRSSVALYKYFEN